MRDDFAERYFSGRELYGDDFTPDQIRDWYESEKNDYASQLPAVLDLRNDSTYQRVQWRNGFRLLPPDRSYRHVLGFGAAYGHELRPILRKAAKITVVESGDRFARKEIDGFPVTYVKPSWDGRLAFDDGEFDLITALDVLHHIPNVTFVLGELTRCLERGGDMLLCEPITTMGDWRKPRSQGSQRERGIPLGHFRRMFRGCGLKVLHENFWSFPGTYPIMRTILRGHGPNSHAVVELDALICKCLAWNVRYHARNFFQKLRPGAVFFVLTK
jgi:hypothetical protein